MSEPWIVHIVNNDTENLAICNNEPYIAPPQWAVADSGRKLCPRCQLLLMWVAGQ